jgi:hypothetical protein
MTSKISWYELIGDALRSNGETWDDIVSITLTTKELAREFKIDYEGPRGKPFAAWTQKFVYFPLVYDGGEWCGSAPRHPSGVALSHQDG